MAQSDIFEERDPNGDGDGEGQSGQAGEVNEAGKNGEGNQKVSITEEGTIPLSNGRSAGYVIFSPNNAHRTPVVLCPGIPSNQALMEPSGRYIAEDGHEVTLITHSVRGNPVLVRPEAITRILSERKDRSIVVGHSYASIDIARALEDYEICNKVGSVLLVAPAGVRENSLLNHSNSYNQYLRSGKTFAEKEFLRKWDRLSRELKALPQLLRAVWDITRTQIVDALLDFQDNEIPVYILEPTPDTLLSGESLLKSSYPYPSDCSDSAERLLNNRRVQVDMGDHSGVLIDPQLYGKPLRKILRKLSE